MTVRRTRRASQRPDRRLEERRAFTMRIGGRQLLVLSTSRPPSIASLSETERLVLRALLAGDSNAAIARRRGTSVRTCANQVASIFRKLGVGSRAELAAYELLRVELEAGTRKRRADG